MEDFLIQPIPQARKGFHLFKKQLNKNDSRMSKKKVFALRIDEEMFKAIEKWASNEFRSTNGQIEYLITQALKKANPHPKQSNNDAPESDI